MKIKSTLSNEMTDVVLLHSAIASAGGIKGLFSSFGFVHSEIRKTWVIENVFFSSPNWTANQLSRIKNI